MIQDIKPDVFSNEYKAISPKADDVCFVFANNRLMAKTENDNLILPKYSDVTGNAVYLFEINGSNYFLAENEAEIEGFRPLLMNETRPCKNRSEVFAAATAYHLYVWYRDSRFCGHCGEKNGYHTKERAMACPKCGTLKYPSIAPAVIVALTDGDRIMMTKYADRDYKRYALVAGFIEIGETAEETVRREVMEEVGLKVKNIRYYKTQPWGFASNLLLGYFCELDGDDTVNRDENELSVAKWMHRDEMDKIEDDGLSLTREMMRVFKENRHK
jgi:NAD+ diphosphatase